MRSRIALGALATAALLAAALLPMSPGTPLEPVRAWAATELHFLSVAPGEPRRQAVLAAIADFEKAHPDVKVVLSEIPFDQYFQKATIALASGSGVDVFDVDSPLVASYGYQGALLPLDKYYTKENVDDFIKVERDIATYQGKMLTAPMGSTSVGLFVNVDLFRAAGAPLPSTDPAKRMTWDQLVEIAKKVQVEKNGVVDVWGFALQQYDRPYQLLPLLQSNGADVLNPDGRTVNGSLNSPAAIEAARWYSDLFNKHKVSPREQVPNLFYTGKLAMYLAPSYEANTLTSQYPSVKWIVAPHPSFKRPVTATGAWHTGVYAGTKYPDLAAALVRAYTDPRRSRKRSRRRPAWTGRDRSVAFSPSRCRF
jgi:multiple sugar transport system substrate-binding protein